MSKLTNWIHVLLICLSPYLFLATNSVTITITNKCTNDIWPAVRSNSAASPRLPATAFVLRRGESRTIYAPSAWSGRIWGRTLCSRDGPAKFSCVTGDCGGSSATPECTVTPPATTLAEFALNGGSSALGVYYVSLLHGFNLPMSVVPRAVPGKGNCTETGCFTTLNEGCPKALRVVYGGETVGCRSACEAFGEPYCCAAASGCKAADSYSKFFENSCQLASVSFACASNDYVITFCPLSSSSSPESSSTQASSDQLNREDQSKIYSDYNKSKFSVGLKILVIFLAIACGVGLVGLAAWCFCGGSEAPRLLQNFSPSTCNCPCSVACISVG